MSYQKNESQKSMILKKQADFYFASGRYSDAARCFARARAPSFEEICLLFLDAREDLALRTYLLAKLKRYNDTDVAQSTLLCFWIFELYLVELGKSRDIHADSDFKILEAEFRQFLSAYYNRMDADTVYQLIDSQGGVHDKLFFAELCGDCETVIDHWVTQQDFKKASLALMAQV
jgi:hypothetical protein